MALLDGQWQVRDLVMGPGTRYNVRPGTNPWNRSARADQSGPRPWNHGGYSGAEWLNETIIPFRVVVIGTGQDMASWLEAHNDLQAAFDPIGDDTEETELRFAIGGSEYVVFGRPRGSIPDTGTIALGHSETRCVFAALDPRIYSAGLQQITLGLPQYSGGLTVPMWVPAWVEGVKTDGEAEITNSGKADTPLDFRITGSCPEPRVTIRHPDGTIEILQVEFDLPDSSILDIDTGTHEVTLDGGSNRRGDVTGDFPLLRPGTSRILFDAVDFDPDASLRVQWRYAW